MRTPRKAKAKIYNLFVALYNEDGTFLQVSDLTANEDEEVTDSNNEIQFKGLKAGASYRALAFANVPKDALTATANSFELTSAYYVFSGEGANGLPMSSGISPKFTLAEGENYYGYSNTTGGHSIESGKPLGLIRNVARVELSALDLDMTKVKVDGSQKYKSGTIKFVPKDVFVLHGRTKAKVQTKAKVIQSGSICQIRFGVILPLLMKLLMEMIIIPGLTLVTHSAVLLELSMLLII